MDNQKGGNTSQMHGKDFENLLKTTWNFKGACDHHRKSNAIIDIEAKHDQRLGISTSVKFVVENGRPGLSDATRFFELTPPHRLAVGEWRQVNDTTKSVMRIHEFLLMPDIMSTICGNITAAEVLHFHMRIASHPLTPAGAKAARLDRDEMKARFAGRHHEMLSFDCKAGEYQERRLQLSIDLRGLIAFFQDYAKGKSGYRGKDGSIQPHYQVFEESYCQYPLPFLLLSQPRRLRQNIASEQPEKGPALFEIEPSTAPVSASSVTAPRIVRRQDDRMDEDLQRKLFR